MAEAQRHGVRGQWHGDLGTRTDRPPLATGNDIDNRAAVAAVATEDLSLAGFAVAGDRRTVDKALDKLRLHS